MKTLNTYAIIHVMRIEVIKEKLFIEMVGAVCRCNYIYVGS